jgi:hypothetical protein
MDKSIPIATPRQYQRPEESRLWDYQVSGIIDPKTEKEKYQ